MNRKAIVGSSWHGSSQVLLSLCSKIHCNSHVFSNVVQPREALFYHELKQGGDIDDGMRGLAWRSAFALMLLHARSISMHDFFCLVLPAARDGRSGQSSPLGMASVETVHHSRMAIALYPYAALLNHSCAPNCVAEFLVSSPQLVRIHSAVFACHLFWPQLDQFFGSTCLTHFAASYRRARWKVRAELDNGTGNALLARMNSLYTLEDTACGGTPFLRAAKCKVANPGCCSQ